MSTPPEHIQKALENHTLMVAKTIAQVVRGAGDYYYEAIMNAKSVDELIEALNVPSDIHVKDVWAWMNAKDWKSP